MRINIGGEGEFLLDGLFAFSDFQTWGNAHNNGFHKLIQLSKGKETVFDIGAHIGLCTLPISKVLGPKGRCYAFEPAEINLRYLRRHIALNSCSNVEVVPFLVGSMTKDMVTFYESDEVSGMHSRSDVVTQKHDGYKLTTKPQVSVDDFCRSIGRVPDLIKIDVEGAEFDVLLGLRTILTQHRPSIILSVHPRHLAGMKISVDHLMRFINDIDYKVIDMDGFSVPKLEFGEYYVAPSG